MTDLGYRLCTPLTLFRSRIPTYRIPELARSLFATIREWRHRYRSRQELALYSYDQRRDLGYAPSIDAEIEKPFWRK